MYFHLIAAKKIVKTPDIDFKSYANCITDKISVVVKNDNKICKIYSENIG